MKKLLMGLILTLVISITAQAHHLNPLGYCSFGSGSSFFGFGDFSNNEDVEIRYDLTGPGNSGTNWVYLPQYTTVSSGAVNYTFSVPQLTSSTNKTIVQFRYRVHDTNPGGPITPGNWTAWSNDNTNVSTTYSGCAQLPVKFISFEATPLSKQKQ